MAQHHFVVFYDTDDQRWHIEHEDDSYFGSGSIWNEDTQEWSLRWEDHNPNEDDELAVHLLAEMFIKNEC
jgi:hypothetical protein